MFEMFIRLLGGYTESDMLRKYMEGRLNQANNALNAHVNNSGLVGAAYKNKIGSILRAQRDAADRDYHEFINN